MLNQNKPIQLQTLKHSVTLLGGYHLNMTVEEKNMWHVFLRDVPEFAGLRIAECYLNQAVRTPGADLAIFVDNVIECEDTMFRIADKWAAESLSEKPWDDVLHGSAKIDRLERRIDQLVELLGEKK